MPILGRICTRVRNAAALVMVLAALVFACCCLPSALQGTPYSFSVALPLGLSFGFLADTLAVFMAITSSLVAAVIVVYSFGYIKDYDNQNEYYMMVVLFIGAMMGLVLSTNLIFIYTFWEISAVCCWRLIGFYRTDLTAWRAGKAFLITVGGALLMLVGFVGIYGQTGTFDVTAMRGTQLPGWAVVLILCGILSKSATVPFHTWLPDAGVAPSPVTSLLHAAVLVKIGVYVYARLFVVNFTLDEVWSTIVPAVAAVSAIISAGAALRENDIKRIIAFSTISQLAFILLGLSCGNAIGFQGGLLYIFNHSIAKAGLFLCAGIIEHTLHTKDIRQMGGLVRVMPKTAFAFIFCAFSIMGTPPFGGFFAKYLVISGAVGTESVLLAATFIVGAVMTVLYLARAFVKVFLGEMSDPKLAGIHEHGGTMTGSVLVLAALSLLAGIAVNIPNGVVSTIVEQIGRW